MLDDYVQDDSRSNAQECAFESALNPEASAFVDRSRMDTNELSHFYANDQSLRSLHSQSLAEDCQSSEDTGRVYTRKVPCAIPPTSGSTKRKEVQSPSPPRFPAAKRTQGSPLKTVRESLVDICLRPTRSLRSKGPAPDVPNIPIPAEYRAYRRQLERLEAQDAVEPSSLQDVAVPEDVPRD